MTRGLTFAQAVKLERLPEDTRVIGWCPLPPGPVVRYADGGVRLINPFGRLIRVKQWEVRGG